MTSPQFIIVQSLVAELKSPRRTSDYHAPQINHPKKKKIAITFFALTAIGGIQSIPEVKLITMLQFTRRLWTFTLVTLGRLQRSSTRGTADQGINSDNRNIISMEGDIVAQIKTRNYNIDFGSLPTELSCTPSFPLLVEQIKCLMLM